MKKCAMLTLSAVLLFFAVNSSIAADLSIPDSVEMAKEFLDSAAARSTVSASKAAKIKLIDINSASESELMAVPGIGNAYAARIIAGRPYANKAQLKPRNIMPVPAYEKVKDLIIAKQPKK